MTINCQRCGLAHRAAIGAEPGPIRWLQMHWMTNHGGVPNWKEAA